jgi:NADPH-dependent 7-cyano-7-deazaguanine reductase QueF-like protein
MNTILTNLNESYRELLLSKGISNHLDKIIIETIRTDSLKIFLNSFNKLGFEAEKQINEYIIPVFLFIS